MPADAWDDDWIQKADSKPSTPNSSISNAKLSKAERRAQQAEFNRKLWEDAEKEQEENYFLKTQGVVPLKSEFKPAVKVLSRKPTSQTTNGPPGVDQLGLNEDDEDEDATKTALTPEERMQKAQKEREEKQRTYEERRRELFGKDSSQGTGVSNKKGASPRNQSRNNRNNDSRPSSSTSVKTRQLFDPNESAKPDNLRPQKKESQLREIHPIREPKAPDGNGFAGFVASQRGGRST